MQMYTVLPTLYRSAVLFRSEGCTAGRKIHEAAPPQGPGHTTMWSLGAGAPAGGPVGGRGRHHNGVVGEEEADGAAERRREHAVPPEHGGGHAVPAVVHLHPPPPIPRCLLGQSPRGPLFDGAPQVPQA